MATNIAGVGNISSAGIGSGLDVSSIVSKLMSLERAPLTALENQATSFNTRLSTLGRLQSLYSSLRDKSNALVSPALWTGTTATASDSSALKVSTTASAVPGSYAVAVNRLAVGQTAIGATLPDTSTRLGAGTLTIELGSYGDGSPAADFSRKTGSSAITVTVGDADSTLAGLRDKINMANAGVLASIVTDASGARLSIRSRETGAENAFRLTASDASDDGNAATGLSALGFDATAASSAMQRTSSAANADLTINGIAITSASNTLSNVVDGLTVTLQKASPTPVDVTVKSDTAAVRGAITDFAAAFNALASYLHTQTAYNADNKTGGSLQGDQGALGMQSQLRGVLNEASSASTQWGRLSGIGMALKADGTLETSTTKLDNALENLGELRKLLATDGSSSGDSGFARRFKRLADDSLGTNGSIDSRSAGLRTSLNRNSKSQVAVQKRLDQTEARLRAQYTTLDTTMAKLSTTSAYVKQQFSTKPII